MTRSRTATAAIAISLLIGSAGCGGGQPADRASTAPPSTSSRTPNAPAGSTATITIQDNTFIPHHITISTGQMITWVNRDAVTHTVTATAGAKFDVEVPAGKSFSYPTDEPDTIRYTCRLHPGMAGDVTVAK